jgi:RNA polymerase sigma-70 factor (ECF subfamily)
LAPVFFVFHPPIRVGRVNVFPAARILPFERPEKAWRTLDGSTHVIDRSGLQTAQTFRTLVADHQRRIYALARRLTGNHHDAEDLAQEVFLQAHRSLDSFRGDGALAGWLNRIAINTFLARRRRKTATWLRPSDRLDDVPTEEAGAPDRAAETDAIRREVARAMEALSPQERAAFVLRFQQDYAVREVAEALGVAEGTVKSLLHRAVYKLRKALGHLIEERI